MDRRVLLPTALAPLTPPMNGEQLHTLHGLTMGTSWTVKLVAPAGFPRAQAQAGIQATLDRVVREMSQWEADSDLARFNRADAGSRHALPAGFAEVLGCALDVAHASDGAFDPSVGELVALWGFGPAGARTEPPPAPALAAARARCGWQKLDFDARKAKALQPGGLHLDFSGIAKGFGVDEVARHLAERGVESYLVEVGGELRGLGVKPNGQPWWVALETPPGADDATPTAQTIVALHGLAVASSGDYRRYFEHAGQCYAHTLDPRSGWPVAHACAQVSVVGTSCMWADAQATALTVLGLEAGMAYAQEHDIAALFLLREGAGFREIATPALQAMAAP
ncbi:FAD:protein FMN transferase [Niveibacterium sp. SC-1]|uniref:FAD:protein FMN transferase n=1 Tax=Niveibacterium sp. SC-1 TaxID=3135646 RepID=UPI00311F8642